MSDGLTRRLAAFARNFRLEALPPARRARLEWILTDFIGCMLGGASTPEAEQAHAFASPGAVPVIGLDRSYTPESAAVVMGTLGALLQLHDGFGRGGNHPCAAIVPAALVAAHRTDASHADTLAAICVGYEIANNLAAVTHPHQTRAGSAPTSTMGAIGAAAAAGRLHGLAIDDMAAALAIAAFYAPVAPFQALREHASAVPFHGGIAARAGLEAVRMVELGLSGGDRVLEGEGGPGLLEFLRAPAVPALDPEKWRGESLDLVYFKPLPGCRHMQPAVEAVLDLLRHGALPDEPIATVHVGTYPLALEFKEPPRTSDELYDRLMSVPWGVATALAYRGFGVDAAFHAARDRRIEDLIARIAIESDAEFTRLYPAVLGARVEVRFASGAQRTGECRMLYGSEAMPGLYSPAGTITPPLDDAGLERKFIALSRRALGDDPARRLFEALRRGERVWYRDSVTT